MEEGIRIIFGRAVDQGVSLRPGIHFKYPWPVEKVIKEKTKEIRQIHIGNITSSQSFAGCGLVVNNVLIVKIFEQYILLFWFKLVGN